jgi:spore germination protein GerM
MKKRRKSKKTKSRGKVLFLLILIGIIISVSLLFRKEISNTLKPWFKKKSIPAEKREVLLYFSDFEEEYLIGEKRKILKKSEVKEEAKEAIIELIKGPKGKLIPTVPPQTRLLSLQLDEKGVAKVNFNEALSKDHPGGSSAEMMSIYSIVNSLTLNFPQIKKVQILIEGKTGGTIAGHLSLDQPISSKPELIGRR